MKLLVTGGEGMLARAVQRVAHARGDAVAAFSRAELDVTDARSVRARMEAERPDAVVQCAAYTAVDRAETAAEGETAYRINVDGAEIVARECQKFGSVFVYPSSDYVFDGVQDRPYLPCDPPNPLNVYGRTKWLGERAALEAGRALVVRTSWLYGAGGSHFVDTMIRLAATEERLEVVDDQLGRPTWTVTLAETIDKLLKVGAVGTFHASGGGEPVSWAGFAREIVSRLPIAVEVRAIKSSDRRAAATRPKYSVLDLSGTEAAIGAKLPEWRESLERYLAERARTTAAAPPDRAERHATRPAFDPLRDGTFE